MSSLKDLLNARTLLVLGVCSLALGGCSDDDDDDDNVDPGDDIVVLTGTIVDNLTLTADKEYLLRGGVFVGNGTDMTVLTIEPGTVIYGESATNGMLVVNRGSRIMAEGTAQAPIVMTSDKAVGDRGRSDWGGLIINGRAPLNSGDVAFGEGGTGTYGGTNPADDSGVLKYVRVEFAGREISPDNELNGIAFQGVGSGTTVDYIQVHMGKDDGVEMFGGNVNIKHVLVTGCGDDQLDWTDGWRGKGQFIAIQMYGDAGDRGIEADNNGEDNDAAPRSHPTLYNLTIVADRAAAAGNNGIGMLLREGTGASIHNAIVLGFRDCGIDVDHEATFLNGWSGTGLNGNLVVNHSIFHDNVEAWQTGESDEAGFPFTTQQFISVLNGNNRFVNPNLTDPYNKTAPNFLPQAGSIALSGGATPPADGFFDATATYVGAFGAVDWTAGWTTHAIN